MGVPFSVPDRSKTVTTAMQVALAVIEHSLPGFEKNRQQLHWLRLTAQAHDAAMTQLTALVTYLRNSADKLSQGSDFLIYSSEAYF